MGARQRGLSALPSSRGTICATALREDGLVALGGNDCGDLVEWDVANGRVRQTYWDIHRGRVTGIAFGHAGDYAMSTSSDGDIKLITLPGRLSPSSMASSIRTKLQRNRRRTPSSVRTQRHGVRAS